MVNHAQMEALTCKEAKEFLTQSKALHKHDPVPEHEDVWGSNGGGWARRLASAVDTRKAKRRAASKARAATKKRRK